MAVAPLWISWWWWLSWRLRISTPLLLLLLAVHLHVLFGRDFAALPLLTSCIVHGFWACTIRVSRLFALALLRLSALVLIRLFVLVLIRLFVLLLRTAPLGLVWVLRFCGFCRLLRSTATRLDQMLRRCNWWLAWCRLLCLFARTCCWSVLLWLWRFCDIAIAIAIAIAMGGVPGVPG